MDNLTHVRREDTNVRLNQKGINKDIAMKIFSKLSVKDLVRFKCVSKHWDRIISDPMLTKLYINPNATTNMLLFLDLNRGKGRVAPLPPAGNILYKALTKKDRVAPLPPKMGPTARVLGYVDGLICMSGEPREILLYNPSTRECRVLTLPDGCSDSQALPSKRFSVDEDMGRLEIADKKERAKAKQLSGGPSSRRARRSKRSGAGEDMGGLGIIDIEEYETCSKLARPSKMSGVDEDRGRLGITDTKEYETCSKRAQPSKMSGAHEDMNRLEIVDKKELFGDVSGASGRCRRIYLGGIGYDWKTCDYKVVVILFESYNSMENNKVMVFSLRKNSWREVRGDFPYFFGCNNTHRIPVNGAIHWFVRDQNHTRVIISFDLSTEEVREIPVPDHGDYAEFAAHPQCRADLGALEGSLVVILHNQYDRRRRFYVHVWLMEEYSVRGSWRQVKLRESFTQRLDDDLILGKPISFWNGPMFICKNGEAWVLEVGGNLCYLLKKHDHKDYIATPMGIRNTMLAFQDSPVSPFGGLS